MQRFFNFRNINWCDSYSNSHKHPNIVALNFSRLYLLLVSVISIVLLQFTPHYSESFKIFLNFIWFPGVNLGLTASGFILGYDFYTEYHISWKKWMREKLSFYITYYFYAICVIIVGVISLAIMQNTNFELSIYNAPLVNNNFLSTINYGWTTNPNAWYGFIALYSLIPLSNFYIIGTLFVVTLFFFLIFAPFIFNFMNKISFSWCTTFFTIFTLIACFLSTWSDVFAVNPNFRESFSQYTYVNLFTNWFLIFYLFIAGFYIRKYTKIIPWKIALLIFLSLSLIYFSVETGLDFLFQNLKGSNQISNEFNVFYLGTGICSLPNLVMSYLFLNIFATYRSRKKLTYKAKKLILFAETSQKHISDQFILIGVCSRFFLGIILFKVLLNYDISSATNHTLNVGESVNKELWSWSLFGLSFLMIIFIYCISTLKNQLFTVVKKSFSSKKKI